MLYSRSTGKNKLLFQDLVGDYIINVVKQDGAINTGEYHFNFYKRNSIDKAIQTKKKNNRLFCKFEVAEEDFSFPEK